jgi:hypothetical protein
MQSQESRNDMIRMITAKDTLAALRGDLKTVDLIWRTRSNVEVVFRPEDRSLQGCLQHPGEKQKLDEDAYTVHEVMRSWRSEIGSGQSRSAIARIRK